MRRTALLLVITILTGLAVALPAGAAPPAGKVTICHKPGTPAERTITVALAAVPAHAAHGDYLGECGTGSEEGGGPGNDTGPIDACTAINSGSLENLLFQGNEVVRVTVDYPSALAHVIWFQLCNADRCAALLPLVSYRAHDEFNFPWQTGGLWEEGPITICLEVRPTPASISITCSHATGP